MSYEYRISLYELGTGKELAHGGTFFVTTDGAPAKVAITDTSDASITQPGSISNGDIVFRTAESVASVDVILRTAYGYNKELKGLTPGQHSIGIDTSKRNQIIVIPFDIDDSDIAANTEKDSGIDLVTGEEVLPFPSVKVTTADSGITIDAGLLSSESSGDADGFIDGISLTSAVVVLADATITTGSNTKFVAANPTIGALLADHQAGSDTDTDEGMFHRKSHICNGTNKSLGFTLGSSADTGAGYILYKSVLPAVVS